MLRLPAVHSITIAYATKCFSDYSLSAAEVYATLIREETRRY